MATTQPHPKNKPALKATVPGAMHLVTSSEARRDWKNVTERALAGENIAIRIGTRTLAFRPVELTDAEEEYRVTETQLHGKAQEILGRARKERSLGKTGSDSSLL